MATARVATRIIIRLTVNRTRGTRMEVASRGQGVRATILHPSHLFRLGRVGLDGEPGAGRDPLVLLLQSTVVSDEPVPSGTPIAVPRIVRVGARARSCHE